MSYPCVSIITPCYNGAEFIDKYFQSILNQTYPNLELIFINDGSTDSTEEIAQSYRAKLEQRGIKYLYLYQENLGQAAAINQGLAIFHGEYFVWPDSDDLLAPDSIEKRVRFLQKHPDEAMVRSNGDFFDYDTGKTLCRISDNPNRFHTDIFMDLIMEESYCCCGCYMVRREAFLSIYPDRKIEVYSAGQNWQILIPLTGRYSCGYIDEDLYHIAVRSGSHSRQKRHYEEEIQRQEELKTILLSSIRIAGRHDQDYEGIVEQKYLRRYFQISVSHHEDENGKQYYSALKKAHAVTPQDRQLYLQSYAPFAARLYQFWRRGCGKLKRTIRR